MDLKDTYNKIAKDWHADHHADDWWHEGTNKFLSFLKPQARILDVGCGAGHKTHYLIGKGFQVMGVDFSENLLAIAKREVPNAEFVLADMRDLSEINGQFDAIFSQASLLHIPKKGAPDVLSHWLEKLKSGGYFYLAVKGVKEGEPDEHILRENNYGYEYERLFSYFSMEELKEYFHSLNLDVAYENELESETRWLQIIGRKS